MEDCIFCKIVQGELPSFKIYEDEHTLAFLDITPANKGHTLVVSKKHVKDILETDEATLQATVKTVKKVAQALDKYSEGINIVQNNKAASGQIVFHLHFHIVPRYKEDGIRYIVGETKESYKEGEAKKVAEDIKKLL